MTEYGGGGVKINPPPVMKSSPTGHAPAGVAMAAISPPIRREIASFIPRFRIVVSSCEGYGIAADADASARSTDPSSVVMCNAVTAMPLADCVTSFSTIMRPPT